MPNIHLYTSKKLTEENRLNLKKGMGRAIELIPGKKEEFLMITLTDNQDMCVGGKSDRDFCVIELSVWGHLERDAYQTETKALCDLMQNELGIDPWDVNVLYREVSEWGSGGALLG